MGATKYTDAGISPRTTVYAMREMLKYAGPVMVLDKFALSKPMPPNKGQVIKFRRPKVFDAATTPLVEGVTPAATSFSYEDVTCMLKQYGQVVQISDVIADTHEDPVLNDASKQSGENIGRTIEALTYGVLKAGTNVVYANGALRTSVNAIISLSLQRKVTRALQAQKAMLITSMLDGSPNFGTSPIEAAYIAVAHTDMENDIRGMPGFIPVASYGSRKPIHERELGTVETVRYILSPDLPSLADAGGLAATNGVVTTSGTNADVYPVLYFGKEAYGTVPLKGMGAVEPSIIPVGQKTKDDVLGQRGYVGWKTWFAAVILNQLWMVRAEVGCTAL